MGLLDEAIREHLELKRLRGADPVDVARMEREALGPARRPDSAEEAAGAVAVESRDDDHVPAGAGDQDGEFDALGTDPEAQAPSVGVYDDQPAPAPDYSADASYAEEAPPVPADWSDRRPRRPLPELGEEGVPEPPGAPEADDRSIAPASYGQETAEFDVESAVLGHEPIDHVAPPPAAGEEGAPPGQHAAEASEAAPPPPAPDEPGPYGETVAEPPADAHPAPAPAQGEGAAAAGAPFVDEPTQLHHAAQPSSPVPAEPAHPAPAPADGTERSGQEEEPGEDVLEETPDFLQETPEHERLWFEQRPPRDFDFDK